MCSVEKLWKKLWGRLRENCGEKIAKWWKNKFSTKRWEVFHSFGEEVEKFTQGFTNIVFPVRVGFYTVSTGLTITTIIFNRKDKNGD